MGLDDDIPAEIPELVREYPTLEEYQARWDRLKEHHARPVPGAYCCDNLVPKSVPELWQEGLWITLRISGGEPEPPGGRAGVHQGPSLSNFAHQSDCPYVPFNKLASPESQARLSVCRPHSSLEEASCASGVPRYSHITGSVDYRRRAPLQLASLLTESRWSFMAPCVHHHGPFPKGSQGSSRPSPVFAKSIRPPVPWALR